METHHFSEVTHLQINHVYWRVVQQDRALTITTLQVPNFNDFPVDRCLPYIVQVQVLILSCIYSHIIHISIGIYIYIYDRCLPMCIYIYIYTNTYCMNCRICSVSTDICISICIYTYIHTNMYVYAQQLQQPQGFRARELSS